MAAFVSLRELVDEVDTATDGCHVFVNQQTGELYGGTDDSIAAAEDDEDEDDALPDWQREMVDKLREVLDSSNWLEVPTRSGAEDYALMERFCLEQCSERIQDELLATICGRGAFGRFKDVAARCGVLNQWYEFRRAGITADLERWLQSHGVVYEPSGTPGSKGTDESGASCTRESHGRPGDGPA